ncbi:hypothetical protein K438DRAFT_2026786 [Mycena galopus ATCC 62051]|nr:hypothetical protein K438DRAFT_2026786 [Mycena galopus ATCC 62051]
MKDILNSDPFDLSWELALIEISGTCVQICFYTMFLILFIIAIHNLRRRETVGKNILLTFSWALAALGTTQLVLSIRRTVEALHILHELVTLKQPANINPTLGTASQLRTYHSSCFADQVVLMINNFAADLLFLYRCYVIWGRQKKVLIVPGILIISTVVVGCIAVVQADLFRTVNLNTLAATYIMSAITDMVLVALTAGRIWLKQRDAVHIADNTLKSRYNKVIATIVESGALYCVLVILLATAQLKLARSTMGGGIDIGTNIAYQVIASASAQLLNIMPTFIIVRAGKGHNIQDKIEPPRLTRTTTAHSVVKRPHSSYGVLALKSASEEMAENSSIIV